MDHAVNGLPFYCCCSIIKVTLQLLCTSRTIEISDNVTLTPISRSLKLIILVTS